MIYIKLLLKRLGLALLFYEICRLLFLLFNWNFFKAYSASEISTTFFYGLLFDISALVYINSIFILGHILPLKVRNKHAYQRFLKTLFQITNGAAILLNCIDFGYFHFSSKRTGSEIFSATKDIEPLILRYLQDYWYLALLFCLLIVLTDYLYPKLKKSKVSKKELKQDIVVDNTPFWKQAVYGVVVLIVCIIGARGGFYLKPIRPFDAARFTSPGLVPLTLNTPFTVISTLENPKPEKPQFFSDDKEALSIFNPEHQFATTGAKKLNIVIIILESFGKEYIGYFNKGHGYTPFLDSLCSKSLVFTNAYANGKHSIDAVPSILSSIPSMLEVPFINSYYQTNRISSLGKLLQKEGYATGFYHGAFNGTMGFDNFIRISGFGPYYGLNEYTGSKEEAGEWGIPDEPYLQYLASELNTKQQPFCCTVFTLSSHHPYTIPDRHKDRFPEGANPIHKSIRYADYSLGRFFHTARQQKWFKNTLFVITADHSADNDLPRYQTFEGRYEIPLLFYRGDGTLTGKNPKTVQQTDIMPGILQYIGYGKKFVAFGNSPFDPKNTGQAFQFENSSYQYIQEPYVLQFDGSNSTGFFLCPPDTLLRQNILSAGGFAKQKSERNLKAFLQVFHKYLDENRLEEE